MSRGAKRQCDRALTTPRAAAQPWKSSKISQTVPSCKHRAEAAGGVAEAEVPGVSVSSEWRCRPLTAATAATYRSSAVCAVHASYAPRVISGCHLTVQLNHFTPGFLL
jgi:hypothetical protein